MEVKYFEMRASPDQLYGNLPPTLVLAFLRPAQSVELLHDYLAVRSEF